MSNKIIDLTNDVKEKIAKNEPIKLLIGGSPCTYWSICRRKDRETTSEGLGWELFYNYYLAKEKFKPDYFLYENNYSISNDIKVEISKYLKSDYDTINAADFSGQQRKRCFWHNFNLGDIKKNNMSVEDVMFKDIILDETGYKVVGLLSQNTNDKLCTELIEDKVELYEIDTYYFKGGFRGNENEPILVGSIKNKGTYLNGKQPSQQYRIYLGNKKGICLNTGKSTSGIYIMRCKENENIKPLYHIVNNKVEIDGELHDINLSDGYYIVRKLIPIEAERLQCLPDNYTKYGFMNDKVIEISETQRYKAIGNGWCAEVIKHIMTNLKSIIPKDYPIEVLSLYDGIGTGRYVLEELGFTNITYKAYEIDKYAISISSYNYKDIEQCGDAFQIREAEWKY